MDISQKEIGNRKLHILSIENESECLSFSVHGVIGNSVPTSEKGKLLHKEWKRLVASSAKILRGSSAWDPDWHYCITCGFSFHMASHGNRKLDVENFIKPTLDALAAGLFCSEDQDPRNIQRYDYDDSNFRYMLIQRLEDARSESEEGVAINISVRK